MNIGKLRTAHSYKVNHNIRHADDDDLGEEMKK